SNDAATNDSVDNDVSTNDAVTNNDATNDDASDVSNSSNVSDANNISDVSATIASDSAQFTPAFEPGSVFEKVSNGEFSARKEVVSAGGFTSEEAQKTDDFAEQFEMAKYQELLPFLAMNTNLYDDLYAWLSAQGNADVDQALAQNSGYSAYRNAIGL
ncbi:FHA domain-containing protein, partial [Gardnerella piotii]